jgi:pimeloyl-ACP methyl ester carboxylesterase
MIFDTYVSNPEINQYPLGEVDPPTLVISAVDDPMALHENARTLADQIPNAQLMAVPDGGHLLLGHTEEVRAEVMQFLRSQISQIQNSHQNSQ